LTVGLLQSRLTGGSGAGVDGWWSSAASSPADVDDSKSSDFGKYSEPPPEDAAVDSDEVRFLLSSPYLGHGLVSLTKFPSDPRSRTTAGLGGTGSMG
jgi:hypothetical protein